MIIYYNGEGQRSKLGVSVPAGYRHLPKESAQPPEQQEKISRRAANADPGVAGLLRFAEYAWVHIGMKQENPIVSLLFDLMLKIYLGLIGTSALRELITLFMTERTEEFRQYQMIFGVSFRVHTLSNLFYMLVYQSFFLIPFYLTLNYYNLDPAYILDFAALVISSSTLTLALTTFFRDHKIALEVIGMLFSLGSFLPFLYDASAGNTWLNFIVMAFPNSSFTIAILNNKPECALISLAFVKLYLLIYSIGEFP